MRSFISAIFFFTERNMESYVVFFVGQPKVHSDPWTHISLSLKSILLFRCIYICLSVCVCVCGLRLLFLTYGVPVRSNDARTGPNIPTLKCYLDEYLIYYSTDAWNWHGLPFSSTCLLHASQRVSTGKFNYPISHCGTIGAYHGGGCPLLPRCYFLSRHAWLCVCVCVCLCVCLCVCICAFYYLCRAKQTFTSFGSFPDIHDYGQLGSSLLDKSVHPPIPTDPPI